MRRRAIVGAAALVALAAAVALALAGAPARSQETRGAATPTADRGRVLFQESCSSCHGLDARGVRGRGPSLRGVGEQSADFYLRTGRMPLDQPDDQPMRNKPQFSDAEIRSLV